MPDSTASGGCVCSGRDLPGAAGQATPAALTVTSPTLRTAPLCRGSTHRTAKRLAAISWSGAGGDA
jgi:hypothetical protein